MDNFWDNRYSENGFAYGINPNVFFKEQLDKLKAGNLLLPLEGEGRNAIYAASKSWIVDAVDSSEVGHDKACNLAKENGLKIKYFLQDISAFKAPDESYDAIGLIFAHLNESIRENLHRNFVKMLKPKGVIILEAFSKKQIHYPSGGPKEIDMLYSLTDIKNDFNRLKILNVQEKLVDLKEGKYHLGKGLVIRMVAQKR